MAVGLVPRLNPLRTFPLEVGQEGRKGDVLHGAVSIGMLAELALPLDLSSFINCCTVHLKGYPSVADSMIPTETAITLKTLLTRPDRLLASNAVDDLGRCHGRKLNCMNYKA